MQMQAGADALQRQNAEYERERQKVPPGPLRSHAVRRCGGRGAGVRARVEGAALECKRDLALTPCLWARAAQLIKDNERLAALLNQDPAQEAALLQVNSTRLGPRLPSPPAPPRLREPLASRHLALACAP
jgi:hypothetical protein